MLIYACPAHKTRVDNRRRRLKTELAIHSSDFALVPCPFPLSGGNESCPGD